MKTSTKPANASADEVQTVVTALEQLHQTMTFLKPLSAEQRVELRSGRIGPKSRRVLESRVKAARKHRDLLPPTFDLRRFERDVELAGALQSCLARLEQMSRETSDTLLALGSHVLQDSAIAYGYIKVAASAVDQLHNTVDALARTRSRRANPGAAPSPAPPPAPAPVTGSTPVLTAVPSPEAPKQNAA